jgi:hypothetical protein
MAFKKEFNPGEIVPASGICKAIGPRGGETGYETTVEEGERFPPTEESGDAWVFVRKTKHKSSE